MDKPSKVSLVLWDWNGTLLDDVQLCVENFNDIITAKGLAAVTVEHFRSLYRHPVKQMYEDVGMVFDEQYSFADLSKDWYLGYERLTKHATLFSGAKKILSKIKDFGVTQILVSALEHEVLMHQAIQFEVSNFFADISGHHDMEAESKIERGVLVWKGTGVKAANTVMIGDSDHDLALAEAIGCRAVLVDTGHQSLEGLKGTKMPQGVQVLSGLPEAYTALFETY